MTRAIKQNNHKEEKKKQAQMGQIIKIWQKQFIKEQKEKDTSIEFLEEVIDYSYLPIVETAIEPVFFNPFINPKA